MSASVELPAGLRERKKAKTRASIRSHAFRLFSENGFGATTIEQIAEAAEVSPSTFFRYFPTKEAVALVDDLDAVMVTALAQVPADLAPIPAIKAGLLAAIRDMDEESKAFERERQRLIMAEPELRSTMFDEFARNVNMLATMMAKRVGVEADSFPVRVFAGAVIGAMFSGISSGDGFETAMDALDLLDQGLPLTTSGPKPTERVHRSVT